MGAIKGPLWQSFATRFVPDCSYILLTDPSFIPSCISGGISFWTSFSFNQSLRFCKLYAPGPGV